MKSYTVALTVCLALCYISFQVSFVTAQKRLSTRGHFFHQIKGDVEDEETENYSAWITEELLGCERNENCSYLVKNDTLEKGQLRTEKDVVSAMKFDSVLKKLPFIADCKDIYNSGITKSGIYNIQLQIKLDELKVYCDMETDGGGWTVIQRRVDGTTNFNRNWIDYRNGFGDLEKNTWFGLENMHYMTGLSESTSLRVELVHWSSGGKTNLYAKYSNFKISSEADRYRLHVSGYSGTAGDGFIPPHGPAILNGMQFSSPDLNSACAKDFNTGWWYNGCFWCNLNGLHPGYATGSPQYMSWRTIDSTYGTIFYSEMKIRRN